MKAGSTKHLMHYHAQNESLTTITCEAGFMLRNGTLHRKTALAKAGAVFAVKLGAD